MRKFWKQKIRNLKIDIHALYLASKEPTVPWRAKALIALIIGYALCPIDLIPDFVPVLGQIDDLIIVPLGIAVAIKMIPEEIMKECRLMAQSECIDVRAKWIAALAIISLWVFLVYLVLQVTLPIFI